MQTNEILNENIGDDNLSLAINISRKSMGGFFKKFGDRVMTNIIVLTLNELYDERWKHYDMFFDDVEIAKLETNLTDNVVAKLYKNYLKNSPNRTFKEGVSFNDPPVTDNLKLLVLSDIMLSSNINEDWDVLNNTVDFLIEGGFTDSSVVIDKTSKLLNTQLHEKKLTKKRKNKREKIVKGMKKNKADLKKRYGDRWEDVMYATATKRAMGEAKDDDVGSTRKPDRYPELGAPMPDSGRTSAEIAKDLIRKAAEQKNAEWTKNVIKGKDKAEKARIEKFKIYTTQPKLKARIKELEQIDYDMDHDWDKYDTTEHRSVKKEIKDANMELKRRIRVLDQERKEAKKAGFTKTVYGKVRGDEIAYRRAIKAEIRAIKAEEKAKKLADKKAKTDAFKKISRGAIDRRGNTTPADMSKPWHIMKLKGGRKEYRKILHNTQHPRHQEAKDLSPKSESMVKDFESFISEWSLNPMDWFDDDDTEKDDLDKIPGDDSGMIKKNVRSIRNRNRKTKRAADCIIQGKDYDEASGSCR